MKNDRMFASLALLLLALCLLTIPASPASASTPQDPECNLTVNRNRVSVTVSRGPCTARNFPAWCDAYIPRTIIQGQTIPCETVVIVATATATPAPRPTPRATPTPLTYLERLRRSAPFRGFR